MRRFYILTSGCGVRTSGSLLPFISTGSPLSEDRIVVQMIVWMVGQGTIGDCMSGP